MIIIDCRTDPFKGEYFHAELTVHNAKMGVWQGITNLAVLKDGTNANIVDTNAGNVFVPRTPEAFGYDLDGNLTNNGQWKFSWDAENRLIAMESLPGVPPTARQKLQFAYDYRGRRINKKVHDWNPSTTNYQSSTETKFLYDGWNLIATLNPQLSTLNSFTWGLDASGSEQGAGGVGGLLWSSGPSTITNQPSTHFACFDGNGNVMAMVSAADSAITAQYEYGPFGELLRASGLMAREFNFLFSTKFYDWETGLYYYGYRYYDPSTGRWLSRDPIGERGGDNLYSFSGNDILNFVDYLGLKPDCSECAKPVNVLSASPDAPGMRGNDKIAADKEGSVARLLSHIVNQIQKGECVKRLTIVAHANPDIVDIGGSPDSTPPRDRPGRVNRDVAIDERNARRVGERIKKLICFCRPCEVYLLSCNVGLGKIAQELANGTGCRVYAPNGYCYPNRKEPDHSKIVPKTSRHPAYPGAGDEFVPFDPKP